MLFRRHRSDILDEKMSVQRLRTAQFHNKYKFLQPFTFSFEFLNGISSCTAKQLPKEWQVEESGVLRALLNSLTHSFSKFGNIFFVILLIISESLELTDNGYFLLAPLILNLLTNIAKSLIILVSIKSQEQMKLDGNHFLKVDFTSKQPTLQEVVGISVDIGDVLLLKKKAYCPADIVLLDCKDDWCFVDTIEIDGCSQYIIKRPLSLIKANKKDMSSFLSCYKEYFTGKMEYSAPNRSEKEFLGYLKLQNDPKGQDLAFENIVLRGSQIKYSDWILGIVIQKGREITSLSQLQNDCSDRKFENFLNRFMQMGIVWIVIGILTTNIWKSLHSENQLLSDARPNRVEDIIYATDIFSTQTPIVIYALVDFALLLQKYFTERKFRQKKVGISVNNPDAITNFCHIDYAVFGHAGAITKKDQEDIVGIIYDGKFFNAQQQDQGLLQDAQSLPFNNSSPDKADFTKNSSDGVQFPQMSSAANTEFKPITIQGDQMLFNTSAGGNNLTKLDATGIPLDPLNNNSNNQNQSLINTVGNFSLLNNIDASNNQGILANNNNNHINLNDLSISDEIQQQHNNSIEQEKENKNSKVEIRNLQQSISPSNKQKKLTLPGEIEDVSWKDKKGTLIADDLSDSIDGVSQVEPPQDDMNCVLNNIGVNDDAEENSIQHIQEDNHEDDLSTENQVRGTLANLEHGNREQSGEGRRSSRNIPSVSIAEEQGQEQVHLVHLGNIKTPNHGIMKNQEKIGRYQETFQARNEKEVVEDEEDDENDDEDDEEGDDEDEDGDDENGEEIQTAKKNPSQEGKESQSSERFPPSQLSIPNEKTNQSTDIPSFQLVIDNSLQKRFQTTHSVLHHQENPEEQQITEGEKIITTMANAEDVVFPTAAGDDASNLLDGSNKNPNGFHKYWLIRPQSINIEKIQQMALKQKRIQAGLAILDHEKQKKEGEQFYEDTNKYEEAYSGTNNNSSNPKQPSMKIQSQRSLNSLENQQRMRNVTDMYTNVDIKQAKFQEREIYKWSDYTFTPNPLLEQIHSELNLKDVHNELEIADQLMQEKAVHGISPISTHKGESAAEFIKALVLCHQIKTKKPKDSLDGIVLHDLSSHEESILLRLAQRLDVPFIYSGTYNTRKFYQIKFKSKEIRYEIKAINIYTQERGRFSIILKEQNNVEYQAGGGQIPSMSPCSPEKNKKNSTQDDRKQFMLVRGDERSVLPKCIMSKAERDRLNKMINNFAMNGMHFIIYARKSVSNFQISEFKKQIQMAANQESNSKTEAIIDHFESDLQLLGVVCLRQKMVPEINKTVDILRNSDIAIWLLSGDKQQKAIAAALQAEIIAPNSEFLIVDQTDYDELKFQIKSHLLQVQKLILKEDSDPNNTSPSMKSKASQVRTRRLSSMVGQKGKSQQEDQLKKLVLQISGKALMLVLCDDYLKSHFSFLCMMCRSVVAFEFSYEEKGRLTRLIHDSFVIKPTVLAVGSSWCDSWMMHTADVSIQVESGGDRSAMCEKRILGDLLLSDLGSFKQIVLDSSLQFQEKLKYLVILVFKYSFFYTLTNYILALHSYQFYSTYARFNQILITHFLQLIIGSLFIFTGKFHTQRSNIISIYPTFYRRSKKYFSWIKPHFLETIVISAIQALLVSVLTENAIFAFNTNNGKMKDSYVVSNYLCVLSTLVFTIMAQCANGIFSFRARLIHIVLQLAQIALTFYWNYQNERAKGMQGLNLIDFSMELELWVSLITVALVILVIETSYHNIIRFLIANKVIRKFLQDQSENLLVRGFISDGVPKSYIRQLKLQPILDHFFYANMFKALFAEVEMDGFLRKIIDPGEKVENLSGINKLQLKFNDERLEKSYRQHKLQFVWTIYLKPITLMSLILSISTLQYLVRSGGSPGHVLTFDILRIIVETASTIGYSIILFAKHKFSVFQLNKIVLINIRGLLTATLVLYSLAIIFYESDQVNQVLQEHLVLFSILSWDALPPPLGFQVSLNLLNYLSLFIFVIASDKFNSTDKDIELYQKTSITIVFFFFSVLNLGSYYNKDKLRRDLFLMENKIKLEENKVDQVLANLLPDFVRSRFNRSKRIIKKKTKMLTCFCQDGDTNIEEDQGEVAIMFIEIVSFDEILKEQDETFIQWLDNLYRSFDQVCLRYGVQKIETVGKVYMAASGLDVAKQTNNKKQISALWGKQNETKQALEAAFAIQKKAQKIYWGTRSSKTILKIGIHHGRVIAGVIGYHKPQFSLIGDTVNTTSRVCSHCEANMITISEQAHLLVKDEDYIFRTEIFKNVKGKGDLTVFKTFKRDKIYRRNSEKEIEQYNIQEKKVSIQSDFERRSPMVQKQLASLTSNNLKSLNTNQEKSQNPINNINNNVNNNNGSIGGANQSFNNSHNNSNFIPSISSIHQSSVHASSRQDSYIGQLNNNSNNSNNNNNNNNINNNSNVNTNSSQYPHTILHQNRATTKKPSQYIRKSSFENLEQESSPSSKSKTFNQINQFEVSPKRKPKRQSNTVVLPRASFAAKLDDLEIDEEEIDPEMQIGTNQSQILPEIDQNRVPLGRINAQKQSAQTTTSSIDDKDNEIYLKIRSEWFLTLENEKEETVLKFNKMRRKDLQNSYQAGTGVVVLISLFKTLMFFQVQDEVTNNDMTQIVTMRMVFETALFILMILYSRSMDNRFLYYINIVFFTIAILLLSVLSGTIFTDHSSHSTLLLMDYFEMTLSQTVLSNFSNLTFPQALLFNIIFTVIWIVNFRESPFSALFIVALSAFELMRNYFRQKLYIQNYNQLVRLDAKKTEKDSLLRHLLPQHVLTKFFQDQQKKLEFQEKIQDVTMLFADISGFTSYSSKSKPEDVVRMLRELFIEFDKAAIKKNVYKVYTIGDCYVVLGMTNINNRCIHEEAHNVMLMGFSMIETIKVVRDRVNNSDLQMRIGIHTGKFLGGILGTNIVRYDIFGEDVVIANKVESNGVAGRISVSEATKTLLENNYKDEFKFETHTMFTVKNFNESVQTYLVERA